MVPPAFTWAVWAYSPPPRLNPPGWTGVMHRPKLVLAAGLLGELLKWGDALSVMQRVQSKVKPVWVRADEHWLGNTDSLPASWRKCPTITKWCSFWLEKSNTGRVLCYLGSKPLGAYAPSDRSHHHPPLIPASQCHTGGPCYAQLPSPACKRRDRQTECLWEGSLTILGRLDQNTLGAESVV